MGEWMEEWRKEKSSGGGSGGVELRVREEWWRRGWRNRGVEGRVKGVPSGGGIGGWSSGVVEWREERSGGGADGGIEE
jgi:hypothetical protein